MNAPALTSLVGGRRREGDEVVPDVDERAETIGRDLAREEGKTLASKRWARPAAGGMRQSSSGSREQGKVARDFFTQWKTVYLDAPPTE